MEKGKVKEIECVVFVTATPGSKLRDMLQERDNQMAEIVGAPALRFVEKGGDTILDIIGQSDPWKGETYCQRTDCLHCKGRQVISQEREDLAAAMISGEQPRSNPPKGTMNSIPGCTSEGIVYSLECMECRRKDVYR